MTRPLSQSLRLVATLTLIALLASRSARAGAEAHAPEPGHSDPTTTHTPAPEAHAPAAAPHPGPTAAAHATPPEHAPAPAAAQPAAHAPAPKPEAHAPVAQTDPHAAPDPHAKKTAPAAHASTEVHGVRTKPGTRTKEEFRSLLKLGTQLTDRGDYESAEIALYQILNSPGVPTAELRDGLLALARLHRKQGALTKAVAIYERFLKDYPDEDRVPDALLDLGRSLRALGIYKIAISRFYSVINTTLKLPGEGFDRYQLLAKTAQFEIAETHFQSGDFATAAKFFSRLRLLDLAPADRARAHYKAAYSLRLLGQLENSVSTLRAYIEQWPDDENIPEARYLLAITLRELKRPQEALTATLELLRVEKSRVAADQKRWIYWQRRTGNQLANDFFESGDTLNALGIYTGLVALAADPLWRIPLTYQIALCHERLSATDRARAAYRAIIEEAGATPAPDVAELVRMSQWRLEHLDWTDKTAKQITNYFETTTGKMPPAPPPGTSPSPTASPAPASASAPAMPLGKTASTP